MRKAEGGDDGSQGWKGGKTNARRETRIEDCRMCKRRAIRYDGM
jgi:hypothetical protein